jgi:tetratricopeptide (TPR) repeat protein
MRDLSRKLDALDLPNRLAIFDGAHMWPPEEFCAEAVAWMEVRAMKDGRRPRDEALLGERFAAALAAAQASERAGNIAEAFALYGAVAKDFAGLADVSQAEAKARHFEKSDEVKRALKEEERQIEKQRRDTNDTIQLWMAVGSADEKPLAARSRFRAALRSLDEAGQKPADTPERRVARRTLYSVFAYFIETGMGLREQGKYGEAIEALQAATEAAPRNPWPLYELARTQARDKNVRAAVESLAKAVELGFANPKDLAENPDWTPLRDDAGFKALVEKVAASR